MLMRRIQKLLFTEYCDFEDMVLVESPFVQTTREGRGISQVYLGLTPSKFIIAADFPNPGNDNNFCRYGSDPDIENFELVSIYPVERVNLSVFRRRKRYTLKARFCNSQVRYFELGGTQKRKTYWAQWCERVKFLNPEDMRSTNSETSVMTSTSSGTVYVMNSGGFIPEIQVRNSHTEIMRKKWSNRGLFLGKGYYTEEQMARSVQEIVNKKVQEVGDESCSRVVRSWPSVSGHSATTSSDSKRVNRFGSGIEENCNMALVLRGKENKKRDFGKTSEPSTKRASNTQCTRLDGCVRMWEDSARTSESRHPRRYAFCPQNHFLSGLGCLETSPVQTRLLQLKKVASAVELRTAYKKDSPLCPSLPKHHLSVTVSCEALHLDPQKPQNFLALSGEKIRDIAKPVIFWTTGCQYCPSSAKLTYRRVRRHLTKIRRGLSTRNFLPKFKNRRRKVSDSKRKGRMEGRDGKSSSAFRCTCYSCNSLNHCSCDTSSENSCAKKKYSLHRPFKYKSKSTEEDDSMVLQMKQLLYVTAFLTAWDFDSSTLAYQITMIDSELYLKVTPAELADVLCCKSTRGCPNIMAIIYFSQRISCLISTEVTSTGSIQDRARLIGRFIKTANKCHRLQNFQSCRSILSGLQSPPVYRLHRTWDYVREKHSTKYESFHELCRVYRDPRLSTYQYSFRQASRSAPYIPYIGDILCRIMGRVPQLPESATTSVSTIQQETAHKSKVKQNLRTSQAPLFLRRFISLIRLQDSSLASTPATSQGGRSSNGAKSSLAERPLFPLRQEVLQRWVARKWLSFTRCRIVKRCSDNPYTALTCLGVLHGTGGDGLERLKEVLIFLRESQKASRRYALTQSELVREYLLKTHYKEHSENFRLSFKCEQKNGWLDV